MGTLTIIQQADLAQKGEHSFYTYTCMVVGIEGVFNPSVCRLLMLSVCDFFYPQFNIMDVSSVCFLSPRIAIEQQVISTLVALILRQKLLDLSL